MNFEKDLIQYVDKYISIGKNKVFLQAYGEGRKTMICLHGFGEKGTSFNFFRDYFKDHQLIFVDLPFHGRSEWSGTFGKEEVKQLFQEIFNSFVSSKYILVGYSLGGRVALTAAEIFPMHIQQLFLLAPDGLINHPFYHFVVRTTLGNFLFKRFIKKGGFFIRLVETLSCLRVIRKSLAKFVVFHYDTIEKRKFVHQVWIGFRALKINYKIISGLRENLQVDIYIGKYDAIVKMSHAKSFLRRIGFGKVIQLQKGHRLLDNETAQLIQNKLK